MTYSWRVWFPLCAALFAPAGVGAQLVDTVGPRASGMGGAFVAVANDSSATWSNPAGLAAGPFLDLAVARSTDAIWLTAATPPFGLSYYRFHVAETATAGAADGTSTDREHTRVEAGGRLLAANQFGVTVLRTLVDDVHVGATIKYVRVGGMGTADLDVGALAIAGAIRLGAVVRNVRAPLLGAVRLDRQVRAGVAFDGERAGLAPLSVALDFDLRAQATAAGPRRAVAAGAERWFAARRVGVRAGGRVNTVGAHGKAGTAGASLALRPGFYVDGHVALGSRDEDGWGAAARVSF